MSMKDLRKGTVLECELHLLETPPPVYQQAWDGEKQKHYYTDTVLWQPYRVVWLQKKKGKTLVRVGEVKNPFTTRYGPNVTTTYDPETGKWWGHDPDIEELIKSGKWRDLPVLDTTDWEVGG